MNIKVLTDYPVALDSADYLDPYGSMHNNSTNKSFNQKLYSLFLQKQLKILDLGCAGGGFVEECNNDGHFAIGIDGSDYPKKNNLYAWSRIPEKLFNADITHAFNIVDETLINPIKFNVITAWELLEHIPENKINTFLTNVTNHLEARGFFIVSINVASKEHAQSIYNTGWGEDKKFHHRNIKPPEWWDNKFREFRLFDDEMRCYFQGEFIRGPGFGCSAEYTEERYNKATKVEEQWATINRVLELR